MEDPACSSLVGLLASRSHVLKMKQNVVLLKMLDESRSLHTVMICAAKPPSWMSILVIGGVFRLVGLRRHALYPDTAEEMCVLLVTSRSRVSALEQHTLSVCDWTRRPLSSLAPDLCSYQGRVTHVDHVSYMYTLDDGSARLCLYPLLSVSDCGVPAVGDLILASNVHWSSSTRTFAVCCLSHVQIINRTGSPCRADVKAPLHSMHAHSVPAAGADWFCETVARVGAQLRCHHASEDNCNNVMMRLLTCQFANGSFTARSLLKEFVSTPHMCVALTRFHCPFVLRSVDDALISWSSLCRVDLHDGDNSKDNTTNNTTHQQQPQRQADNVADQTSVQVSWLLGWLSLANNGRWQLSTAEHSSCQALTLVVIHSGAEDTASWQSAAAAVTGTGRVLLCVHRACAVDASARWALVSWRHVSVLLPALLPPLSSLSTSRSSDDAQQQQSVCLLVHARTLLQPDRFFLHVSTLAVASDAAGCGGSGGGAARRMLVVVGGRARRWYELLRPGGVYHCERADDHNSDGGHRVHWTQRRVHSVPRVVERCFDAAFSVQCPDDCQFVPVQHAQSRLVQQYLPLTVYSVSEVLNGGRACGDHIINIEAVLVSRTLVSQQSSRHEQQARVGDTYSVARGGQTRLLMCDCRDTLARLAVYTCERMCAAVPAAGVCAGAVLRLTNVRRTHGSGGGASLVLADMSDVLVLGWRHDVASAAASHEGRENSSAGPARPRLCVPHAFLSEVVACGGSGGRDAVRRWLSVAVVGRVWRCQLERRCRQCGNGLLTAGVCSFVGCHAPPLPSTATHDDRRCWARARLLLDDGSGATVTAHVHDACVLRLLDGAAGGLTERLWRALQRRGALSYSAGRRSPLRAAELSEACDVISNENVDEDDGNVLARVCTSVDIQRPLLWELKRLPSRFDGDSVTVFCEAVDEVSTSVMQRLFA